MKASDHNAHASTTTYALFGFGRIVVLATAIDVPPVRALQTLEGSSKNDVDVRSEDDVGDTPS